MVDQRDSSSIDGASAAEGIRSVRRQSMRRRLTGGAGAILGALGMYLLWSLAWYPALKLPVPASTALLVLVTFIFLYVQIVRGGANRRSRRHARLQLRAPALSWPALGSLMVLTAVQDPLAQVLYGRWVDVPAGEGGVDGLAAQAYGWLPLMILVVIVGPLIEEFMLRGWLQGRLVRLWGSIPAVMTAAVLFAGIHASGPLFAYYLVIGALYGSAVLITRSVWTGVLLHASSNAMAMFLNMFEFGITDLTELFAFRGGAAVLTILVLLTSSLLVAILRHARSHRRASAASGAARGHTPDAEPAVNHL